MKLSEKVAGQYVKVCVRRALPRAFYLPKEVREKTPMTPRGTDLAIYTYEVEGVPYGIAFQGKAQKPLWNYRFRSEDHRSKEIKKTIENRKRTLADKAKKLEERRKFQHGFKVGDILYSSWGYDQTNVNFYQVTKLIGKMIEIREVASKVVREERGADYVVPVPNRFVGKALKKKPSGVGGRPSVKINSYMNAYPWDGKPKYETASGWGH